MARKIATCIVVVLIGGLIYVQGTHIAAHKQRVERVLYGSPISVLMCDEEKEIVVFNPEAIEFFEEDYNGRPIADMLTPESYATFNEFYKEAAVRFDEVGTENWKITKRRILLTVLKKNGEPVEVVATIRALRYNGVVEFYIAMRDPRQNAVQEGPVPQK